MKKIVITLVIGIIVSIGLVTPRADVDACSVGPDWPPAPEKAYADTPVVFVGEVSAVKQIGDINGDLEITFGIARAYKGDITGTIVITTPANSALCGYDISAFELGDPWIVYANLNLSTNYLTLNEKLDSVEEGIVKMDALAGVEPNDNEAGVIPDSCRVWFDGCNTCTSTGEGEGEYACTLRGCFEYEVPHCIEPFASSTDDVDVSTTTDNTATSTDTDQSDDTDENSNSVDDMDDTDDTDSDTSDSDDAENNTEDEGTQKKGIIRTIADTIVSLINTIFNAIF